MEKVSMGDITNWWNKVSDEGFACLDPKQSWILASTKDTNLTIPRFKWLNQIEWNGKSVVEYGCGGGFGGEYLFTQGISQYTGLDISPRGIAHTTRRLKGKSVDLHLVNSYSAEYKADVFITYAVIQHFPSESYVDNFFQEVNKSETPELMVQFRIGDEVLFHDSAYADETQNSVKLACILDFQFLLDRLTNYELVFEIEPNPNPIQYVYTLWVLKE